MYEAFANEFSKDRGKTAWKDWAAFLPYVRNIADGDIVYDIGCGNGRLATWLYDNSDARFSYVGVDPIGLFESHVRNQEVRDGVSIDFLKGDFKRISVESHSSELAFAIASWHHLLEEDDMNAAVEELARVLKPGGVVCMTVWNLYRLEYVRRYKLWHLWFGGNICKIPWQNKHMRLYYAWRLGALKSFWESRGWKVLRAASGKNHTLVLQAPAYVHASRPITEPARA